MAKQGKERIIAAAFQLFLQHGYKGVSLKDIINTTQLSKGAIYYHFTSKYEIYLAAVEEYFFKIIDTESPIDEEHSLKIRIRKRFDQFLDLIDFVEKSGEQGIKFPIRTYFIFQLETEQDDSILARVQKSIENYRQEIIQIVQTAIDRKEIGIDLPAVTIAQQLISMMEGLAIHHSPLEKDCKNFLSKKYEEVVEAYLDLIIRLEFSLDESLKL